MTGILFSSGGLRKMPIWDGTDVSADLSSEALGEGGSLGEGGGHPSLKIKRRRGRGRPRHNVGWASSPVMRGRTCRPKLASSATHPRRTKFPSPEAAQAIGHGRLILNSIRSDLEALR